MRSATRLGEGWTAEAYRVNDELVFKFPKRAGEWAELDREIAFLACARPLLHVATGLSALAGLIALVRGFPWIAGVLGPLAVTCAQAAAGLYRYLTPVACDVPDWCQPSA